MFYNFVEIKQRCIITIFLFKIKINIKYILQHSRLHIGLVPIRFTNIDNV